MKAPGRTAASLKAGQSYSERNVRFIAVSIDVAKHRAKIQPVLEKAHVTLETWVGRYRRVPALALSKSFRGHLFSTSTEKSLPASCGEARDEGVRSAVDLPLSIRSGPAPAAQRAMLTTVHQQRSERSCCRARAEQASSAQAAHRIYRR
jgi:hypothetical protein